MSTSNSNSRRPGKYLAKKAPSKASYVLVSVPVIAVFLTLLVMAWIIPLRPTMSESENRNLEKFPEFTMEALLSGTYFDDIGVWFSDTFTFRDTWINTAKGMERLYGNRDVAIYGDVGAFDDIPDFTITLRDPEPTAPTVAPTTETTVPEETTETTGSTEPTEDDSYDPREDSTVETAPKDATQSAWGGQMIDESEYVGKTSVLQIGNAAYKITGFSLTYADKYSELMNKAAELLDGKARVFTVLAPENTTFMLTREDREKMGCKPEEDAIAYMYSNMNSNVHAVNVVDTLVAHNSEYLAFRTDHHWTATAAYYAYEEWCKSAGFTPVPLSEYEVVEWPGFKGSYYSKAAKSHLLEADTVVAYDPPGNIKLYLSDSSGDNLGWEQPLITNRSTSSAGSKFLTFLAGDHAKGIFINDDITDGSACLAIKTSVGNPFVYYLAQHYQYVYVLDLRYYSNRKLTSFVNKFEIDDVVFAHGTGFAMGSGGSNILKSFIK